MSKSITAAGAFSLNGKRLEVGMRDGAGNSTFSDSVFGAMTFEVVALSRAELLGSMSLASRYSGLQYFSTLACSTASPIS